MSKCTPGHELKCVCAEAPGCTCECGGDNHGKAYRAFFDHPFEPTDKERDLVRQAAKIAMGHSMELFENFDG